MSESTFMKTVLFGGYDRADVEQTFERLRGELFRLQNELSDHHKLISYLQQGDSETASLKQIIEEQRTKLSMVQTEQALYYEKLRASERQNTEKDQEIEKLKARISSLQDKLREKDMKLSAFEADEDNKRARAAIAEIEGKAHSILHGAHKEADQLKENSRKLAENLIADANNTAKRIVYEAETRCAQISAATQNQSSEFEVASGNLRASLLADVERLSAQMQAIQNHFEQFQKESSKSIGNAVQLLSSTDQILKIGGTPVFQAPNTVQPKLPEPPAYTVVSHSYDTTGESTQVQEQIVQPQAHEQANSELDRLQQMANAIAGIAYEAPPVQADTPTESNSAAAKSSVLDLAALAAQADAIANGNV